MRDTVGVRAEQSPAAAGVEDLVEIVDAEPLIDPPASQQASAGLMLRLPRGLSVVVPTRVAQALALTASGFAAGALTTILGRRGGQRRLVRKTGSKAGGKVVASRSFVVDVHLLDKR
jgi:hypothetical protein